MMRWLLPVIGLALVVGLVLSSVWVAYNERVGEPIPTEVDT